MKKDKDKKVVRLRETDAENQDNQQEITSGDKMEKLKKPIIFGLMGIVFVGCMFLIFKPTADKNAEEEIGLNDAVPQASESGLPDDKGKAYEQEMLQQKLDEKRNAMLSLSDYWNEEAVDDDAVYIDQYGHEMTAEESNPAIHSYRQAQSALSSFYEEPDYQTQELQKQVEELKEQLAEQEIPQPVTVDDQLALMEKSYEMAARYMPSGQQHGMADTALSTQKQMEEEQFVAFKPTRQNVVSSLYREPTDSAFLADWQAERNRGFYTAGVSEQVIQPKNSIRAVVQQTQTIAGESGVRLRLLEPAHTSERTIEKGTVLMAMANFQGGRLQMHISSIEVDENIIPVDITIYDTDGQQGLYVPYSPEINALSEIAANMSQTSGTSLMMTRSAGQQVAGDLSRGLVQGVSGYFSKKVRTPKVTLKAGHQLFLVSKQ